jgi:hypothetical protein
VRFHAARDCPHGEPVEVGFRFARRFMTSRRCVSHRHFRAGAIRRSRIGAPGLPNRALGALFISPRTPGEEHVVAVSQADDSGKPDRPPLIDTISSHAVRVATERPIRCPQSSRLHVTVGADDPAPWAVMRIRIVDVFGTVLPPLWITLRSSTTARPSDRLGNGPIDRCERVDVRGADSMLSRADRSQHGADGPQ